jgi:hypothetical protein
MSKPSFTMSLTGETTVGRSEAPGAFEAEVQRTLGDRSMVVVDGRDFLGVAPGLVDRLYGHPAGYRTYGDEDGTPPKGLLAMLALGRMNGEQPCIFLDGGDSDTEPLLN